MVQTLRHCTGLWMVGPALGWSAEAVNRSTAARPGPILVLGDSLSAEYGIRRGSGWVALLTQRLEAAKRPHPVVNASISGETTAGGRSRLPSLLTQHQPAVVILELGGNDALRGLPLDTTRANLTAMTQAAQKAGAAVVIVGMQVPPNYGKAYTDQFAGLFTEIARSHRAALVPFLLKGVADRPDAERYFQPDRIHPTENAHPILLENVWPVLRSVLPGTAPR